MSFFIVEKEKPVEILPGVIRRSVYLDQLMMTFFDIEEGVKIGEHTHPHEQICVVLSGALEFGLGDETAIVRAGSGMTVPSNTPHWTRAIERTKMIDAWHPIREDYR